MRTTKVSQFVNREEPEPKHRPKTSDEQFTLVRRSMQRGEEPGLEAIEESKVFSEPGEPFNISKFVKSKSTAKAQGIIYP